MPRFFVVFCLFALFSCDLDISILESYHSSSSSLSSSTSSLSPILVLWNNMENNDYVSNSLSGANGAIIGTLNYVPGVFGNAVSFSNSGSGIKFSLWPEGSKLWGTYELTIEFWAKTYDTNQYDSFVFDLVKGKNDELGYIRMDQFDRDSLVFGGYSSTFKDINYQWPLNVFHHYAVSISKTNLSYYIDGGLVGQDVINSSIMGKMIPYELILAQEWKAIGLYHWSGAIDNLKVWNYAKTEFNDRFVE